MSHNNYSYMYFCQLDHKLELIGGKIRIEKCPHILSPTMIDFIIDSTYARGTKLEYLRSLRRFEYSSMCCDDVINNTDKYLKLLLPTMKNNKDKYKQMQFVNICRTIDRKRKERLTKMGYLVP